MAGTEIDDATLMAFADGELDAASAARVAEAVAGDPDAAARVELFRRTRAVLSAAAGMRPAGPVPEALLARVQATLAEARARAAPEVVPLRPKRGPAAWGMALAASLALAVGVAGGFRIARGPAGDAAPGLSLAALGGRDVAAALARLPSGARTAIPGGEMAAVASFRSSAGETCREVEIDPEAGNTVVAVACHTGRGWDLRLAVAAAAAEGGYAPASSLEVLDAYLASTEAGAPLSLEEEAAALAALSR